MATCGDSWKRNGVSTFHESVCGFEDNFNPLVPIQRYNGSTKDSTPSTLSVASTSKSTSGPSTPLHLSQPSPLVCYALRLKHGEELRKTLLNFCEKHELRAAFILTCVGSALSAKLRLASALPNCEGNYMLDLSEGSEIVSLQGTISNGGHFHASLADVTGKVIGGHLLELIVDTTVEVVIGECSTLTFMRELDQNTGFKELVVRQR